MKRLNQIITFILLATALPAISYRFIEAQTLADRVDLLGYFTIQSNILVIIVVALKSAGIALKEKWRLIVGAAIIITALIFQLFLRQSWSPEGISALVSNINHGSTAVLFLLWIATDTERESLSFRDLWKVIPYPAAYCTFGIFEAFYRTRPIRYFFMDIQQNGWGSFFLWFAGLTILFLLAGSLVILLDRKKPIGVRA